MKEAKGFILPWQTDQNHIQRHPKITLKLLGKNTATNPYQLDPTHNPPNSLRKKQKVFAHQQWTRCKRIQFGNISFRFSKVLSVFCLVFFSKRGNDKLMFSGAKQRCAHPRGVWWNHNNIGQTRLPARWLSLAHMWPNLITRRRV